jgi:serine/threonine protein kinase/6-phosphogluconolactonase (cycloisomerase 2 family)
VSEESRGGSGEFAVGSVVAGYRLEEQIGEGGMAVVFRAYDSRLDRYVALKIMAPGLALDDAFRQRFIRESRAAAAVDDPHIIPVFEAGEENGVLFIAMRFVRGGDVRSLLDREGPLPPGRATEILSQVASALDSAHARGLVHRDVKPANMLLDASTDRDRPDHVYLSDFGLTKTSLAGTGLTSTGQFLGTLDYVAPEQIEGRPVDGRTDQYALACAAFELLTGAPPFRRDQGVALMYAQVSESPPLLSSRRAGLPRRADDILNRALAKAPADRYATCREFTAALRRVFGLSLPDLAPGGHSPARPPTQIAAPPPRPAAHPPTAAGSDIPAGAGDAPGAGGAAGAGEAAEPAAASETADTPRADALPADAPPADDPVRESGSQPPEPSPSGPPTQAAGHPGSGGTRPGLTDPSAASGGPGGPSAGTGAAGEGSGSEGWGDPGWFRSPSPGRETSSPGTPPPVTPPPVTRAPVTPAAATPGGQPGAGAAPAARPRRPWWRSPVPLAAILVVLLAGGGYLAFGRGGSGGSGGSDAGAANAIGAGQSAVGCSTSTPRLAATTGVQSETVKLGGTPFAVQESHDGQYTFVTVNDGIAVLRNTGGLVPVLQNTIHVPGADKGLAVTHDGRYLIAANGNGAVVVDVGQAEQGAANPVRGQLVSPSLSQRGDGAVGVRISPDDAYVFVTLQNTTKMAVFSLARALAQGFGKSDFQGYVPLNSQPVGIGASPDGQWLYVTSFQRQATTQPSEGTLSVVNLRQAETHPAKSVVSTVNAGCSPARVVTSGDGSTVWVTARDSNAILAFSAAKLRGSPAHALMAHMRVGQGPIGLTLADGGKRLLVADSNQASSTGTSGDLAVINTAAALAGQPALLGALPTPGEPRQVTLAANGSTLLVTNQVTDQLQAVTVADLP